MSGPRVFPCGTNGYPACPPQDASEIYVPTTSIVEAYNRLSFEDKQKAYAELMAHNPNASAAGDSTV